MQEKKYMGNAKLEWIARFEFQEREWHGKREAVAQTVNNQPSTKCLNWQKDANKAAACERKGECQIALKTES